MVEFEEAGLLATALFSAKCALSPIPLPYLTFDRRRDVARLATSFARSARTIGRGEFCFRQFCEQQRQRPIEDDRGIAVGDGMP